MTIICKECEHYAEGKCSWNPELDLEVFMKHSKDDFPVCIRFKLKSEEVDGK